MFSELKRLNNDAKKDMATPAPASEKPPVPTPPSENLPANLQTSKPASRQAGLPANLQARKPAKFSSYLREESVKALKRLAFETDRKDYEVLQEAVDEYLSKSH